TAISLGWMAAVVVAGVMVFVPAAPSRPQKWQVPLLAVLLGLGLVVRGGAIIASPNPVIDVYSVLDQTPRALLRGENPYRYQVVSPYGTERARRFRVSGERVEENLEIYPPGVIVLATPWVAAGLDPRWLMVVCWLAAGVLVWWLALRNPDTAPVACHLAGAVLLMPSASFTTEQAWIDPCYAVLFLGAMAAPLPVLAGALMGLSLAAKQTAVCVLPAFLVIWRRRPRALLGLGVALLALFVPFAAWDAHELVRDLVLGYAQRATRANAMSLPGLVLARTGVTLPALPLAIAALALGLIAAWRARNCTGTLVAGAGLTVCAFSILSKYAYLNWYEGAALLLLASVAWATGEDRARKDDVGGLRPCR
ncbi:MAG TPA: glycosyltransferase 87 family protein, partial [Armatimonadota bacterium]|nr:glycosyltransferase 87 family protein [Armatimonadota bacterium]